MSSISLLSCHELTAELQGHAIKNKDLLAASGAITLNGSDVLDELQEDEQAVSCTSLWCYLTSAHVSRKASFNPNHKPPQL